MGHGMHARNTDDAANLNALVAAVVDVRRSIAASQAAEVRLLSDLADLVSTREAERRAISTRRVDADLPLREVSAELGAAMRVSDRTVQARMGDASTLVSRYPATMSAWETGRIDAGHVSVILDAGAPLAADDIRERFEVLVLAVAETESVPRLRAHARAIAAQLDPDSARERQRSAQDGRCVRVRDLGEGIARLQADLAAPLAYAALDRLTQQARTVQAAVDDANGLPSAGRGEETDERDGIATSTPSVVSVRTGPSRPVSSDRSGQVVARDPRTLDQIRADVFADLLLAGAPAAHGEGDALAAITGHVQVTIPVLTLAGIGEEPALLAGYGPIDTETARQLAAKAPGWDRVMTHPHNGVPLAVDRYRPSSELRRYLAARDEHCRFPGCRMAPRRCDVDHTIDAAFGGPTSGDNLAHFCRRHHTLKHATPWKVRQLGGGVLEWTSPIGRTYQDRPPASVRFVPSDWGSASGYGDDPPPF